MANLSFLHYKTNLFGASEVCLNTDSLLRGLPDLVECYKVDFSRVMHDYKRLPFHAVVAIAPIFETGDLNYEFYNENINRISSKDDLSKMLGNLAESLFSLVPQPAPRYSIRRWFNCFGYGEPKFFFNLDGRIYYGVIIGGRGYQDKVERPFSVTRINTRKIVATATKKLSLAIAKHYPEVANHFNPHCVKLNHADDLKRFSKQFLASSKEFNDMSKDFELQLSDIDEQLKVLNQKRRDLGIEYGVKTRRMLREKLDQMEASDDSNKEQVVTLRQRLDIAHIGIWSF